MILYVPNAGRIPLGGSSVTQASVEVTQWYTFGGWAGLEGTAHPHAWHLGRDDLKSGPSQDCPWKHLHSTPPPWWPWVPDLSNGSSQFQKQGFHQLRENCMTFYDLALEVTVSLPPSLLVEVVRNKCQRICSLLLKSLPDLKPLFEDKRSIL